ncbi:formamidopyrimidine-DNA glycosylase [soil metagenome]
MPELLEIEVYRRLAQKAVGRTVDAVETPDNWFLKGGIGAADVAAAVQGATIAGTGRRGKLMTVDLGADRPVLGLRFGMTGRLILEGEAPIEHLWYGSGRDNPEWDRFTVHFDDDTRLRLSDPRRLGGVQLDPDLSALGPDAWTLTLGQLTAALAGSTAPLKARLLDQHRIAGLGNLLVDESLWRARIDPTRESGSLTPVERRRLHRRIVSTVEDLFARGGSHTGDLQIERHRNGHCPRCGTPLARQTVGGRTTFRCEACARSAAA